MPGVQHRADRDVVEHGQIGKRPHDLERPSKAGARDPLRREPVDAFARKPDRSPIRLEDACDEVEQRRLARAVGADHGEDLGWRDGQRNVVDRYEAAKALRHAAEFEKRRHEGRDLSPNRRDSHGHNPFGEAAMIAMRSTPNVRAFTPGTSMPNA